MRKIPFRFAGLVCLFTIVSAAGPARADDATALAKPPSKQDNIFTGIVASVNLPNHALKVHGWLFAKSFVLADTCAFRLPEQPGAAGDLRPGEKVIVHYRDAEGVLIAKLVEQRPLLLEGSIKSIDPARHTLIVHAAWADRKFQIAGNCRIVLRNEKVGTWKDVQPGHHVTITYELPNDVPTARQIAQTSATFTGSLTAIDLDARTIRAKAALGSKEFHLGDDCAILLNGRADSELRDLKPGDKLTFNYDDVDGVNVASRIVNATGNTDAMTAASK